jgi:hypothetical protein
MKYVRSIYDKDLKIGKVIEINGMFMIINWEDGTETTEVLETLIVVSKTELRKYKLTRILKDEIE